MHPVELMVDHDCFEILLDRVAACLEAVELTLEVEGEDSLLDQETFVVKLLKVLVIFFC